MYKSILVPIDMAHVERAEKMIDIALAQSAKNAQITLLNVIEAVPHWALAAVPDDMLGKPKQSARDKMEEIAHSLAIKANIEVRTGHTYKTILETADDLNADLIIVASHNPEFSDYFLGSTASHVVRHAKCSVFVIR